MPRRDELPTEAAVFPLAGALLLPRGKLPLNIFEPRYLAMIEDAMGEGRVIGMVQPDEKRPDGENGPALYSIGCLGRIASFSETEDGRFLVTLLGTCRFKTLEELDPRRGYRRVAVRTQSFVTDLAGPTEPAFDRAALVGALRRYFEARGFQANWSAIDEMDGDALVTTLSMVCPFEPVEKQALLEAPDTDSRAETLHALLTMGAHAANDDNRPAS